MPIKSSHRVNGYSSRERDNEETVSCKEEEEDEEEEEEEEEDDDDDDDDDDVSEREYFEKLHNLTNQLRQLNDGVHPELCKASKRAENWLSDQRLRIQILHEHKIDEVHCQYEREIKVCEQDCATEKRRIREYLMSLCEDLKKRLEHDKKNIELTPTGDVLELKPAVTRKLRRRTPETTASCGTKFGYWGDILLYGSSWTLPSVSKALSSSDAGTGQCQPTSAGTPLSPPSQTKVGESEPGEQNAPSSAPSSASGTCGSNTNLFGSLSVNVEDSSLMTHLLASLNAASDNGSGVGGLSSAGAYFASSLNQSGSAFSSILTGAAASSAGGSGVGSSAFASTGGSGGGAGSGGSCGTIGLGFLSAAPATSAAVLGFPSAAAAALVGAGVSCLQPPKRRKQQTSQPFTQLTLLLPENDIYSDLTAIHRACGKPPVAASKKHGGSGSSAGCASGCGLSVDGSPSSRVGASSPSSCRGDSAGRDASGGSVADTSSRRKDTSDACSGAENFSPPSSFSTPAVWIDDGRLYCGQTW
uniref:Sin3 histone deacetylase corepressor complex component SDS3 n=2 Tax=Schistocephalus solidus TaxID=70667 RepID=A0A0X3Q4J0_SCHSO